MQNISNKKFGQNSVHLMSPTIINGQSWLHSSESQAAHSSLSNAVSLNLDSSGQHRYREKQTSHQLQDQESSSTQSTGQSHLEMPSMEGNNPHKLSGCNETYGKRVEGPMKSVLSLGAPDFLLPDYCQSQSTVARIPYSYPDPYFSGILAPCGPQTIIHPQMIGVARVPLPLDPAEEEPIYVNPKQYRGILRRRESRAKLEAQNKLVKARKPYLHESRHLHALKRVRGSGGRFLNTKNSEQSDEPNPDLHMGSERNLLKLERNQMKSEKFQSETCNRGASTASCSEISSVSGDYNTLEMSDHRFSSYPARMKGSLLGEGGIMCNGSQYHVPVIR